ncbi:HWE histidine kinase domain-containing protein [Methylobacterium sp. sgz302541]|uniref:HWE histidine kinase domain-containing protein n=1 Tax=unclassified Methylobacterium TaxID=2615210 RepID=UPI003D33F1DB
MGERAERDPEATEDLHRAAFAEAAVGLAVLSVDGLTVRDANAALCGLLGYRPGTLAGRPVASLRDAPASGNGIETWRRADGAPLDVRVRANGAVLVVEEVDPDEAVRAEQNRAALTAAGLGEWRWDTASGRLILSRRAAQILGHPPGPSLTWPALRAMFAPGEARRVRRILARAFARGRHYTLECRMHRAQDGRAIVVGARGEPVRAADGTLAGMVGVLQDVTTRVEARDALTGREQRLRVATSLARLGIFEWHMLEDEAIWENERMFSIFGRSPEDGTVGKTEFLYEILHPEDRAAVRLAISRALKEDEILHVTARIRRKSDGAWRVIDMAGQFERDAPRRLPRRLIGVVADVTDQRRAEERQTLLIRELHHRVKNTLATVQAIVGSTARNASSIETFYDAFVGRIMSLAHTHSVLTEDTWQTADLRGLLVNELKPYAEADEGALLDARVRLDGPPVDLTSEIAVPIGMAIHELTTNAVKYGALSARAGRLAVTWELLPRGPNGTLRFDWRESGGPPVAPPRRQGFGSRLLQRVLTTQVQAEVTTDYPPEGFRLTMLAPMPERNEALNPLA